MGLSEDAGLMLGAAGFSDDPFADVTGDSDLPVIPLGCKVRGQGPPLYGHCYNPRNQDSS